MFLVELGVSDQVDRGELTRRKMDPYSSSHYRPFSRTHRPGPHECYFDVHLDRLLMVGKIGNPQTDLLPVVDETCLAQDSLKFTEQTC